MKAIILAAGKGTRLGKYTENLPKGMLSFNGKSLIERQLLILRECGINDIIIVTGYMKDKIDFKDVKYYHNPEFDTTNMVASLFCAQEEFNDDIIVCYSDIIYEKDMIKQVIEKKVDVGVTVDSDYLDYWKSRSVNWQDDLESLQIDDKGNIFELGTKTKEMDKVIFRYVGILKFSKKGLKTLEQVFKENKEKYWDKDIPWLNSKSFKKAYMTDIIQAIINKGILVKPIIIKKGWMEFDTEEDLEKAEQWLKNSEIKKIIDIDK